MRLPDVHSIIARVRSAFAARPRILTAFSVALVVLVVFGLGVFAGHHAATSNGAVARAFELARHNDKLLNQIAILQRDHQVSQVADRVLQKNLAERDEEIRGLRADQAFYSKLVGADAQPGGLAVHGITLAPIAKTRAYNFTVTMTHSVEHGKEVEGRLTIAVEGIRADKLEVLGWDQLVGTDARAGLPFSFKYFEQVQGTLMLPAGFTPNRIRVTLEPDQGASVVRNIDWATALQNAATGAMS